MVEPDAPFTTSADVYDVIYQWLPYDDEAARIIELVRERRPEAASLLEVGCGTGQFLVRLQDAFAVEGFDLSPQMLDVAAQRVPDAPLHLGDRRQLDLGRTFDAVACLSARSDT